MRAAYAALILGVVSGMWLAGQALTVAGDPAPATVADALGLEPAQVDIDARRAEAVAVLLARCMTGRGLAWTPWVEAAPDVPDADLDPVAWARRWGFGISTAVGRPTDAAARDPNRVAMDALPAAERDRYRSALAGTSTSDAGCQRPANDAVYGLRDRLLAPLQPALKDLDARIAADPGARGAVDAWRRCVLPVAGPAAPDRATLVPGLMGAFVARLEQLGPGAPPMAGLLALQAEERRVAVTVARCDVAFADARAAVAATYERAFIAEHGDDLRRIGAAIRDAEADLPTLPP